MKINYDSKHNVAYITLHEKFGKEVETIRISADLNIDLAPDGTVYGIELLNANEQLGSETLGKLLIEIDGRQSQIPLSAGDPL